MRKLLILFSLFLSLFAIDIDIASIEQEIKNNPNDVNNRLIVTSYYIKHNNYKKAKKYLDEILKIDPNNQYAIKLKSKIDLLKVYNDYKRKYVDINNAFNALINTKKYNEILNLYNIVKNLSKENELDDNSKLAVALSALKTGKYDFSLEVLQSVQNKNSTEYLKIEAYDLYYKKYYNKAKKLFNILYKRTGDVKYAKTLLDIYFKTDDINPALKLILSLKRSNPQIAKEYEPKIQMLKNKELAILTKKYKREPSFANMQALVFLTYQQSPKKAIDIVKEYLNNNPQSTKAKILLAKLLYWNGQNDEALSYLKSLSYINDMEAKLLLGKLLAWQKEYKKAIIYLSDVYENGNSQQKYEAKKALGFIYLWQNRYDKAKEIFSELLAKNPNDTEVRESLMIINGNLKPLIKKYTKLLKKNPYSDVYILKLANFYYQLKDYKKSAYYYERYLQLHPEKVQYYKVLADIYFRLKDYYNAFGNLEYYTYIKNDKDAYLNLAKEYYWHGYNKQAINVLNEGLKKFPNYKPLIMLKAKILKINPRYLNQQKNTQQIVTIQQVAPQIQPDKNAQELLYIADKSYFAKLYEGSLNYYQEYLYLKPDDVNARERYAYALEKSGHHAKSASEFYLVLLKKHDIATKYHYAYNLQKAGDYKRAKKIYDEILNKIAPKPLPAFIDDFLHKWAKAWQSRNFSEYAKFYSKKYTSNRYWREKKKRLFKLNKSINVNILDPQLIYQKGDIYKVRFYQVYHSTLRSDRGYKTLTLKCQNNTCKIINERWKKAEYKPQNTNSAIINMIKRNLKEMQKPVVLNNSSNTAPVKVTAKTKKPPVTLKGGEIKKKDIVLDKSLSLEPMKESEALDLTYIKKTDITKNDVATGIYKGEERKKRTGVEFYADYFKDNQDTRMLIKKVTLSKDIKDFNAFLFYKDYHLDQGGVEKSGHLVGAGFKKNRILADFYKETNAKNFIGWDFEYTPVSLKGIVLKLKNHNIVYDKKSACSASHTAIKAEATQYRAYLDTRELWWSVAYERVDDDNNILTPQVEYDIKKLPFKVPTFLYFSGWYQFNSDENTCYYSPKKTDTNTLGLKLRKKIKDITLTGKGGMGYSFFDNTYVYKVKLASSLNKNLFNLKFDCEYSNTSSVATANDYKSYECELTVRKEW